MRQTVRRQTARRQTVRRLTRVQADEDARQHEQLRGIRGQREAPQNGRHKHDDCDDDHAFLSAHHQQSTESKRVYIYILLYTNGFIYTDNRPQELKTLHI